MPAGEERDRLGVGTFFQILDFANGCARWLFQEDVLACFECRTRRLVAKLRRHAERYRVEGRAGIQHLFEGRKVRDAVNRGVTAGDSSESKVGVCSNGRQMLIADYLADADDANSDGCFWRGHDAPPVG
jgi:hypothetical protein